VDSAPGDKEFLLGFGVEDLVAELDLCTGVEDYPKLPPGSTVMILTVQGTLWAYCSNLPQGLSTFTEGGLSPKYISSPISGQFKPSVRFLGDYASKPARFDLARPLLTRHTALRTSVLYDARRK
jgi:hypothetical protein